MEPKRRTRAANFPPVVPVRNPIAPLLSSPTTKPSRGRMRWVTRHLRAKRDQRTCPGWFLAGTWLNRVDGMWRRVYLSASRWLVAIAPGTTCGQACSCIGLIGGTCPGSFDELHGAAGKSRLLVLCNLPDCPKDSGSSHEYRVFFQFIFFMVHNFPCLDLLWSKRSFP
ncbi:hypothetical protein GQ53DRAFT_226243 [Thozetella sp. PMI_491]|nr:hypothetical protein GQ53DRAFT_226243 [Thozetella sp. PMI_491]